MLWFFKPKQLNVDFFTTREEIFNNARPKKASYFAPKWVKNLPPPHFIKDESVKLLKRITIKNCPAFVDLYSSGFMIPLWSDLNIETTQDSYRYQFVDNTSTLQTHSSAQYTGFDLEKSHWHFKLISPWTFVTNKHVKFMWSAPMWNNFGVDEIVLANGIVSSYKNLIETNVNIFVKKQDYKVYELEFNTPLVHVVPLHDHPIKLNYHLVSDAEIKKLYAKTPLKLMHLNRYRRLMKLCPYA